METEVKKQIKKYSILFGLLVLGYVILYLRVSDFNRQERVIYISASDTEEEWTERDIRITMAPRGGSTDTWIKRIYEEDSNGKLQEIQYAGIIYDIMVVNQAQAKVVDWKLQIEVPDDCFLNNAWCGELEIHQNVGENEVYQALDLRKCIEKKVDIHLNHKIEGTDLMIPVSKGDYFVYLPSVRDEENVIEQRIQNTDDYYSKRVDFISYHKTAGEDMTPMEFTQAKLTYHLEKDILRMPVFKLLLVLFFIWAISVIITINVDIKMKKLLKQRNRDAEIIEQSMTAFMGFIDAKDSSTNGHSLRVAQYSRKIAERLGFSKEECERVYYIGLMHDCGKIGIPENILKKPDKLSPEEYETMKTHTVLGEKILKDFTSIEGIKDGVRYHHERFDGRGYPDGLAGENIPLIARIICVADSFDAMNSVRCYPNHLSKEEIVEQLISNKGTQFDGKIVDCFLEMLQDGTIEF